MSVIYQRQYIESARRFAGVPPLTERQISALDLIDSLMNDSKLNLMMELEPGDIQLVHNHALLHDRTSFEDYPEPERQRHLLRLWLAPTTQDLCLKFLQSASVQLCRESVAALRSPKNC